MKKGFTLIETLIYIALFGLLLSAGFSTVYYLIQGADKNSSKGIIQNEGNFVSKKFDWIFSSMTSVNKQGSGCNQSLTVNRSSSPHQIDVQRNISSSTVEISENGGSFFPITTINASTTCLQFQVIAGSNPGVIATTTLNGMDFVVTKYLRK